jgi:hypothetical protein
MAFPSTGGYDAVPQLHPAPPALSHVTLPDACLVVYFADGWDGDDSTATVTPSGATIGPAGSAGIGFCTATYPPKARHSSCNAIGGCQWRHCAHGRLWHYQGC